ncbi:MAG TPA: pseudouridine synthase [Candidatus Paceibacterota bacterium]|nr:pseudouridine synthase [Candidatus Paceibacterota bacterium]
MNKRVQKKSAPSVVSKFPMRINKYLALHNHGTRRGADELIEKGQVFINGTRAVLGDKVNESDTVDVKRSGKMPSYVYFAFNKPVGMITIAQNKGERDIVRSLPKDVMQFKVFPIGRLDKDSEGLIILTNDARVTDRLLNPKYEHEKTYEVTAKLPFRANFKEKMESGINIEGYLTKPARVQLQGDRRARITLTEGKTHQIRRMLVALFNEVVTLKRVSIMNIKLEKLAPGSWRKIEGKELEDFLKSLDLL